MSTTTKRLPPVSLSVHTQGTTTLVTIVGDHGSLAMLFDTEGPSISIRDSHGTGKYKATWTLLSNGHVRGWWVDTEGKRQWIPAQRLKQSKQRKPTIKKKAA